MEKRQPRTGSISLLIGIVNPIVCTLVFGYRNQSVMAVFMIGVPVVGLLLGIVGLVGSNIKRTVSMIGVLLNLLPFLAVALFIYVLTRESYNSGFGGWH